MTITHFEFNKKQQIVYLQIWRLEVNSQKSYFLSVERNHFPPIAMYGEPVTHQAFSKNWSTLGQKLNWKILVKKMFLQKPLEEAVMFFT